MKEGYLIEVHCTSCWTTVTGAPYFETIEEARKWGEWNYRRPEGTIWRIKGRPQVKEDYKEKILEEYYEKFPAMTQVKGLPSGFNDIRDFFLSKLDLTYEQGKADERERIVEGWKEPNRLAYERGKADGMAEEAIGCFDHSQKDLSDYKKGLVELCEKRKIDPLVYVKRDDGKWIGEEGINGYNQALEDLKNLIQK